MRVFRRYPKGLVLTSLLIGGILFPLVNGLTLEQGSMNKPIDWAAITKSYHIFLELPSEENTVQFLETIPANVPEYYDLQQSSTFFELFTFHRNYPIFQQEIWAGSANATRAAFRLLNLTRGGGFGEIITNTLSNLIRINPNLFLKILTEYKDTSSFKLFLAQLTGSTISAYVDRQAAIKHEWQMRIVALNRVNDPRYVPIRDICIDSLKKSFDWRD